MDTRVTLVALRIRMGYTQEEVAQLLDISRDTMTKWERDCSTMPLKFMSEFARVYRFPLEQIFFGDATAFSGELRREAMQDEDNT
jgi:DNA-binding XRE family transcriptional regulator